MNKAVSNWLFACCGLVFCIVTVGAITRLTESGLSITEWRPLLGAIPPLSEAEWQRVYELYKQSPEFEKKHFWMEIGDFKQIFFWEWLHRLLARTMGIAYAVPFIYFWARGKIPKGYKLKLFGVFLLGGLQGTVGWYMVQSGLIDNPSVSHYRLALHLLIAFLIFACMLWLGLSLREENRRTPRDKIIFWHGKFVLLFVMMTILWGAFTAGLDAGLVYNDTFPKMGERWIPAEITYMSPWYKNFITNEVGVQFTHRWLAMFTLLMAVIFWLNTRARKISFPLLHIFAIMIFVQAGLGILTLLSGVLLPLGVLHQAIGLTVFGLLIAVLHRLRPY